MPRSYLSNEPGAMRALMLDFDPHAQVSARLAAMQRTGHSVEKAELLILGGTWSDYPHEYQEWFVRRCFDALNGADSATLEEAQRLNERAVHRNVGLVVETRPDFVSEDEVRWLRRLGATRVQIGVQSLDDDRLAINGRGHSVEDARRAIRLLRSAGFKIAVHMMPNLLGATPASDLDEWRRLFSDPGLRPDEAKLYPTGLIAGTPLYDHYQRGAYRPYTEAELIELLMACKRATPEYCRLNRVMRDIPAPDIAAGVTASNLRQVVQARLREAGAPCRCIRCREVRGERVDPAAIRFEALGYETDHSREVFLSAVTPGDRLAGFLRLSLPSAPAPIEEIDGQAMIRQVQVYGPALALEDDPGGHAQHQGLGRRLIRMARDEARAAGFERLAVIAAVGTREYYRGLGFEMGRLYMSTRLGA
jgi:elongator complex protein 3